MIKFIKNWLLKRKQLRLIAEDDLSGLFVNVGDNGIPVFTNNYILIENPLPAVSKAAVKKNWLAIAFVKEQTSEVCWIALYQDVRALAYIRRPTEEMIKYCE